VATTNRKGGVVLAAGNSVDAVLAKGGNSVRKALLLEAMLDAVLERAKALART